MEVKMNGASFLIVFVLVVALVGGMVFMADQLNHSAAEILTDRETIQDLQKSLETALAHQTSLRQQLADQTAALRQKEGELESARQALAAVQNDVSSLQQSLTAEQAARAAAEMQVVALRADLAAAQAQAANKATPQAPSTGSVSLAGLRVGGTGLPLVVSAGGLLLAGGILMWGRHERRLVLRPEPEQQVAVRMTRAQAHQYARLVRSSRQAASQTHGQQN
jgi:hypothetical protein